MSKIIHGIIHIFIKLWYYDQRFCVLVIAGLVALPITVILKVQDDLSSSQYQNSVIPFMVWVLLFVVLYYKELSKKSSRGSRPRSHRPNVSSGYRETIRHLKDKQKKLTRKQQEEINRLSSDFAKLEGQMTSILPKPIKTEKEQRSIFHKSPSETDLQDNFSSFTPREMEELTGKLFEKKGYSVEVTQLTGDFGIDVWATNKDVGIIGIQVKKWKSNVGYEDVSKTLGSVWGKGNKCIIISTDSSFTSQALGYQKQVPHLIELWDTNRFKKELREYGLIT